MGKRVRCMTGFIMVLAMLLISFVGVPVCVERLTNAVIKGYVGGETALVIPSALDGNPVTVIGYMAFYAKLITSVAIPFSVTTIGEDAFIGCVLLTVWLVIYAKSMQYASLFDSLEEKAYPLKELYCVGYGFLEMIH